MEEYRHPLVVGDHVVVYGQDGLAVRPAVTEMTLINWTNSQQ